MSSALLGSTFSVSDSISEGIAGGGSKTSEMSSGIVLKLSSKSELSELLG